MFAFLFSGIDSTRKMMTDNPRIVGLFGVFVFLFSSVLIVAWDAPVKGYRQSVSASPLDCAWRSQMTVALPRGDDRSSRMVNDACGEEASEWSRQAALADFSAEKKGASLDESDDALNSQIAAMTVGYPIEFMSSSIAKYDREVAALLVGIAKKESNWGKRVPRSADGGDCFNYWGFKGAGSRGVAMGHGCFGTPEEAVERVGDRIAELVRIRGTGEPKSFTIWKCGSSCATHSPESVRKWVSDVDQYYRVLASR